METLCEIDNIHKTRLLYHQRGGFRRGCSMRYTTKHATPKSWEHRGSTSTPTRHMGGKRLRCLDLRVLQVAESSSTSGLRELVQSPVVDSLHETRHALRIVRWAALIIDGLYSIQDCRFRAKQYIKPSGLEPQRYALASSLSSSTQACTETRRTLSC